MEAAFAGVAQLPEVSAVVKENGPGAIGADGQIAYATIPRSTDSSTSTTSSGR